MSEPRRVGEILRDHLPAIIPSVGEQQQQAFRSCSWCGRLLDRKGMYRRTADGDGWECRRSCSWRPIHIPDKEPSDG